MQYLFISVIQTNNLHLFRTLYNIKIIESKYINALNIKILYIDKIQNVNITYIIENGSLLSIANKKVNKIK